MGRSLAKTFATARNTFAEADEVLGDHLSDLCFEGPEAALTETVNTQPAILTHSVAVASLLEEASSPLDLLIKMAGWEPEYRRAMEPLIEARPLCDTALVGDSVSGEGYTLPLLLAPSIYYGREGTAALYSRIRRTIEPYPAERVISALRAFFRHPGVAVTYWRPSRGARPFRVDVSAAALGYRQPWEERKRNMFVEEHRHLSDLERVLNHLGFWFCNEVEYNLPLHQADMIARFDRGLYRSKYEPFIVRRLEEAGFDVRGRRRTLREVGA
jgi:hypothetical protein